MNDYFPQPKLRYMEKGFSYEDATIIHECLNKGREENRDYNDAWGVTQCFPFFFSYILIVDVFVYFIFQSSENRSHPI